jgi:hypothetical protein
MQEEEQKYDNERLQVQKDDMEDDNFSMEDWNKMLKDSPEGSEDDDDDDDYAKKYMV